MAVGWDTNEWTSRGAGLRRVPYTRQDGQGTRAVTLPCHTGTHPDVCVPTLAWECRDEFDPQPGQAASDIRHAKRDAANEAEAEAATRRRP